jgi:hypothetical protein
MNALEQRIAEFERSFDLRWNCDMRAIKKWQAAGEGRELKWPDHADLCVFLLEQNDRLRKALAGLTTACTTNAKVMEAISMVALDEAIDAEAEAEKSFEPEDSDASH